MEPSTKDTNVSEKTQLDFLVGGLWVTVSGMKRRAFRSTKLSA